MTLNDVLSYWLGIQSEPEPEPAEIDLDDALDLLTNRRRRLAIDHIARNYGADETATLREVSQYIAAVENDCEPDNLPQAEYHTVYVSMSQSHLDALEESDVIERPDEHTIVAGPAFETVHDILQTAEEATGGRWR